LQRILYLIAAGILFLNINTPLHAQQVGEMRLQISPVSADSSYFIGFLINPETVKVYSGDEIVADTLWTFNPSTGRIGFSQNLIQIFPSDRLTVHFIQPAIPVEREYRLRNLITDTTITPGRDTVQVAPTRFAETDLFGSSELSRSGSITRGFTIGNRQDLSLESGLRLELSGQVTDDVNLLATLTDRSTPIQPDGTTQTLREFDRVYIRLQSENTLTELGDIDIQLTESAFGVIDRRVQGGAGYGNTPYGEYGGGLSVTRGQFRTMRFNGLESVQGPYRLTGNQNEAFIIVLAGSERVFINGVRVQRGAENDYIIDYSLGEITFTTNRLITSDSRITVEYQYLSQSFTRTLVTAHGEDDQLLNGRLSVSAGYIREADNANPNTQLFLSEADIDLLRQLGDSVDDTFISGADSVGFRSDADFILYAREDTLFNGENYQIFVHRPGDPSGVFRVRFTNFGAGSGSYKRVGGTVNGILYEWVGPGMGEYEPLIRLEAPTRHQMVTLRSEFSPVKQFALFGEWAVSDFDRNRFSQLDNNNNIDHGLYGGVRARDIETGIGYVSSEITQRFTGRQFRYFDRVREVEFDRRWNLTEEQTEEEENITEGYIRLDTFDATFMKLSGGYIARDSFTGFRREVTAESREQGLPETTYRGEWIDSNDRLFTSRGSWNRHFGTVAYGVELLGGVITPFFNAEHELREQFDTETDSLLASSLRFTELNPGVRYSRGPLMLSASYSYRVNDQVLDNNLEKESIANTTTFGLNYEPSRMFRSENRVGFRKRDVTEAFIGENQSARNRGVLLRSANNYFLFNGDVEGELTYEANTERRAFLQETYIEVGPELGQYVWIDLNGDGVRQIDEFFPEVNPNEGTFIRQFLPSDELFPVIDLRARWRNRMNLSTLVGENGSGLNRVISEVRWSSLVEIRETSTNENLEKIYLLQLNSFRDEVNTISGQIFLQQELAWLPDDQNADIRLRYNRAEALFRRANGTEERFNESLFLDAGLRVTDVVRLLGSVLIETDKSLSSRFSSRGYDIYKWEVNPGVRFRFSRSLLTEFRFSYADKSDRFPAESVSARLLKVENRSQIFLFNALQNTIRLQWQRADVQGVSSDFGLFELTDGAGEGSSLLWNITSDYRVSSLIRASLQYNGRTVNTGSPIQTMRLTVSAVF